MPLPGEAPEHEATYRPRWLRLAPFLVRPPARRGRRWRPGPAPSTPGGATAAAPNTQSFVALQFLARIFATAETLIAIVVIAEEFDPRHRGWGIGALGAIQACGAGLAAVMFGFVDVLPYGWRALYAIGLVPLGLLAYWRRALPETRRFVELRATPKVAPLAALVRTYPGRFWALVAVAFGMGLAISPAGFFAPKFLQDVHGWTPGWVASLNFLGGAFAIVANPFAGWLSDRRGRRPVAVAFMLGFGALAIAFYTSMGLLSPALWVPMIFAMMGSEVTLSAFGSEMFPTSQRSTAAGARSVALSLGAVAGLALASALFPLLGSIWNAIVALCAFALVVPVLVWLAFPETSGRILEEIAPEKDVAAT